MTAATSSPERCRDLPLRPREDGLGIRELTRLQLPATARAAVDQIAAALTPRLGEPGRTPPAAGSRVAAALADLQAVAAALRIADGRSSADEVEVRRLREIRRELLEVLRALAPLAASEPRSDDGVPRTRHLRAASLLPYPARGASALETLLEILVCRRLGADLRSRLSPTETARGAAEDLRAAAAVLHRLQPRPAGRTVAQLAVLAADLHRIARGSAASSIPRSSPAS